jgi:hypothetical protein
MFQVLIYLQLMLQVLHLYVSKVDRVLHVLQCDSPAAAAGWRREGSGGARMSCGVRQGRRRRLGSGEETSHEVGQWHRRRMGLGGAQTPRRVGRYAEFSRGNRVQARRLSRHPGASTVVSKYMPAFRC